MIQATMANMLLRETTRLRRIWQIRYLLSINCADDQSDIFTRLAVALDSVEVVLDVSLVDGLRGDLDLLRM